MRPYIFPLLLVLATVLASCGKKDSGLPNIVLIVADDLGWKDLGFMGSSYYETPNLDRLAGEGMVFRRAYAAAANCAPSRACLLTGMYTTAHGIYTVGSSERGNPRTRRLIPATNTDTLHDCFFTLAEALKQSGYTTVNIGKWHLGNDPCSQGMDYNVGGSIWGHPKSYFAPYIQPSIEAPEGEYLTDRLTEEALGFIRQHRDHPFFLYLPYYAVHTPLQAKPELEQKYVIKGASACQDPLRAGKGSYYEGGIRVPLIFKWPGKIKKGSLSEETPLFFHFPVYLQAYRKGYDDGRDPLFRTRPGSVIIEGKWKLHYYYEDGGKELYNLSVDPGERDNLASINIIKTEELLSKLEAWIKEENAPVQFDLNPQFDSLFEQQSAAGFY